MKDKKKLSPERHALSGIDPVIHSPARLMILIYLYVVDSADFIFLMRMTGLTWGNLSTHLSKLESEGYIMIEKTFKGKKPHTMIYLSEQGRIAFREYKKNLQRMLNDLPD